MYKDHGSRGYCARPDGEKPLQMESVVSVRVANGAVVLPSVRGYTRLATMLWTPIGGARELIYLEASPSGHGQTTDAYDFM